MECGVVDWIHLALDRDQWRALVYTVMNPWVQYKAGNFVTIRFSRRTLLRGVADELSIVTYV
jgi:hypothetical protein